MDINEFKIEGLYIENPENKKYSSNNTLSKNYFLRAEITANNDWGKESTYDKIKKTLDNNDHVWYI